jgi:hypothetical protein
MSGMTISSLANTRGTQSSERPLAFDGDATRDVQAAKAECGDLVSLFPDWTSGTAASAAAHVPSRTPTTPLFKGFEAMLEPSGREDADSLKRDAFRVLQNFDPRDPAAMKRAFAVLSETRPGQFELDAQDNLLLTGSAEGYIGARPFNRESDWTDRIQDWSWGLHGIQRRASRPQWRGTAPPRSRIAQPRQEGRRAKPGRIARDDGRPQRGCRMTSSMRW